MELDAGELKLLPADSRASDIDRSDEPKFLILMSNRHTPAKLHQQAWVIFVNCLYCTWCCFACSAITHKNSSQLRSFNLSICKSCVFILYFHYHKPKDKIYIYSLFQVIISIWKTTMLGMKRR